MSLEKTGQQVIKDTVSAGKRLAETTVKKAWSILDAAVEKPPLREQLSDHAINAIKGNKKE